MCNVAKSADMRSSLRHSEDACTMASKPEVHQYGEGQPCTYPICTGSCVESVEKLLVALDNIACETRSLIDLINDVASLEKDVFYK